MWMHENQKKSTYPLASQPRKQHILRRDPFHLEQVRVSLQSSSVDQELWRQDMFGFETT